MKSSPFLNGRTANPSETSKRPVDLSTNGSSSTTQTSSLAPLMRPPRFHFLLRPEDERKTARRHRHFRRRAHPRAIPQSSEQWSDPSPSQLAWWNRNG